MLDGGTINYAELGHARVTRSAASAVEEEEVRERRTDLPCPLLSLKLSLLHRVNFDKHKWKAADQRTLKAHVCPYIDT